MMSENFSLSWVWGRERRLYIYGAFVPYKVPCPVYLSQQYFPVRLPSSFSRIGIPGSKELARVNKLSKITYSEEELKSFCGLLKMDFYWAYAACQAAWQALRTTRTEHNPCNVREYYNIGSHRPP